MARSKAKEDAEAEAALFEDAAEREQQMMESKERLLDNEHEAERRALVLEKRSGMKQPELSVVETNVTEATSVSMQFRQMALYERFQEVYTIILPKLKETAELMRHYTALESVDVNDPESADILASLKEGVSMAFAGKLGGANLAQSCKDAENLRDRLMNSKASFKSYNALTWTVNFLRERRNAEGSIDEPRGQGLVRKRVYDEQRSGRITSYSEDDGLYSIKWNDGDEVRVSFAVVERLLEDWEEEETDIGLLFAEESDEVKTFLVDSFEKYFPHVVVVL